MKWGGGRNVRLFLFLISTECLWPLTYCSFSTREHWQSWFLHFTQFILLSMYLAHISILFFNQKNRNISLKNQKLTLTVSLKCILSGVLKTIFKCWKIAVAQNGILCQKCKACGFFLNKMYYRTIDEFNSKSIEVKWTDQNAIEANKSLIFLYAIVIPPLINWLPIRRNTSKNMDYIRIRSIYTNEWECKCNVFLWWTVDYMKSGRDHTNHRLKGTDLID